jgi:signal transduction histidine kinase
MKATYLISFALLATFLKASADPAVKKGEHLVIGETLSKNRIIALDGEWEFYWSRLLTPDSFLTHRVTPVYQHVPLSWNNYRLDGKKLPIRGYGTYRLTIANPDQLNDLMLKIPGIATASKVWVNGMLNKAQGRVATAADQSRAERLHYFIKLPGTEVITIIVQASNYEYAIPGISHTVLLGHEPDIMAKEKLENDFEMIEIGCLLIMIFYHLALYLQMDKNPSYLLFSILCSVILVRATTTYHSSLLLFRLFPDVDFSHFKKFEFSITYAALMLLPMFIRSLFKEETPRWGVRVFQVSGSLLLLLTIATPAYIFGQALDIFHVLLSGSFIFVLWVLFRAIRKKRQGAWLIFTGLLLCCVFLEFEMLMVSNVIPERAFPFINPVGMGVISFLLFQSLALSVRFSKAFKDVEDLSHTLEKRVEKRTEELSRANLVKDKLFSIISHDLRSPLNSLRGLLELTGRENINQKEFQQLLPTIRQNLNGSLQLVDNLLNWASTQMKGMSAKPDRIRLAPIVEENLALYKTIARNKNIRLVNQVSAGVEVVADPNMTKLIVRNLVSNGIKFTPAGGSVEISASVNGEHTQVCVADTGVGIPAEFKERIFEVDINRSTRGTNDEKGTGIGLLLCKEFVEKNGGVLWVESDRQHGSKFKFTLKAP